MLNHNSHDVPEAKTIQKIADGQSLPTPPDRSGDLSDWPSEAQMQANAETQGIEQQAGKAAFQAEQNGREDEEKASTAAIKEDGHLVALGGMDNEPEAERAAA